MKIATYNLHLCQDVVQIIRNIKRMADNELVDVFCLQEVVRIPDQEFIIPSLLKELTKDWSAIYHIGQEKSWLNLGNVIVWNRKKLSLKSYQNIILPFSGKLSLRESIFYKLIAGESYNFKRRSIIALFQYGGEAVQIANIHLDNVGGSFHRLKQFEYLLKKINKNIRFTIICGDFNTFDLKKTKKESQALQFALGSEYTETTYDSGWTADINRVNFAKSNPLFAFLIKSMQIHVRRKLDYIWVKGAKRVSSKKLDFSGSDHLPLVVTLNTKSI